MAHVVQPCWNFSSPWVEPAQRGCQGMCPLGFLEEASPTSNWLCEPSRELETRPLLALGFFLS